MISIMGLDRWKPLRLIYSYPRLLLAYFTLQGKKVVASLFDSRRRVNTIFLLCAGWQWATILPPRGVNISLVT